MTMRALTFIFFLFSFLVQIILSFPTEESSVADEDSETVKNLTIVEPFWKTNPSHVDGVELYQGDMLLTEEQRDAMKTRKARANIWYRWTEGSDGYPLVPYIFQDSVNQTDVKGGLDHWMEHTCIKFEETNNTDQPHLQFHIGGGCWSYVGMYSSWNGQQVSIGSGCNTISTIVHEVGHAIGFYHEQSRLDRDDYVRIIWKNIEQVPNNQSHNFEKEVDNNYSVPYDYSSNMHYGESYFNIDDTITMITKDPWYQALIGSRNTLTHRDKLMANRMYNCTGKWLSECIISSDPCLNDGYIGKDCTCICPPGTNGSNCEDIVDDYYATARSPLSEKITTEKTITVETKMPSGTRFTKWIIPPAGKTAKVIFTYASLFTGGCQYHYLRVKTSNLETIGQTLCNEDVNIGLNFTSDTGIIIFMYNNVDYSFVKKFWEAEVTFEDITTTDPSTTQASGVLTTEPGQSTESPIDSSTSSPIEPSTPSSGSSAWEKLKNICVYIKNSFDIKIV